MISRIFIFILGYLEIIKCLVPYSKSPIIVEDNYGETPITRAEKHQDVIKYLLQFSKNNNDNQNNHSNTDHPYASPCMEVVSKSSDAEISTAVLTSCQTGSPSDKDKHIPLQILNRLDGKKGAVCKIFDLILIFTNFKF